MSAEFQKTIAAVDKGNIIIKQVCHFPDNISSTVMKLSTSSLRKQQTNDLLNRSFKLEQCVCEELQTKVIFKQVVVWKRLKCLN